jgi:hypothetical protein
MSDLSPLSGVKRKTWARSEYFAFLTHSGSRHTVAERAGHLEDGSDSSEDLIVCHRSHWG